MKILKNNIFLLCASGDGFGQQNQELEELKNPMDFIADVKPLEKPTEIASEETK